MSSCKAVLIDLGSHTVKIGSVQTEETSDDLFHISRLSASHNASILTNNDISNPCCDEVPTLMGWPKITSLTQMASKNAQEIINQVRYGADCLKQSDLLSLHPIIQSQGIVQDWEQLECLLHTLLADTRSSGAGRRQAGDSDD